MVVDALRAIPGNVSAAAVSAAVQSVNASLLSRGAAPRDVSGSTLVALILRGEHYSCLWAGDSQAWLFRAGAGIKITRDHSLVQELIDAGAMSAVDRHRHPHAHVITRAVGTGDPLLLDKVEGDLRFGDTLLLCSDGLSDVLEPPRLAELTAHDDLDSAADALLAEALERSASDNVTFLLIRLTAP
jgi:protein phosphatase/serine/threonine-protein phosphatase Stp1